MKSSTGLSGDEAAGLASPGLVVLLVLLLGATIYLWRTRHMRPATAYVIMAILAAALAAACWSLYSPAA